VPFLHTRRKGCAILLYLSVGTVELLKPDNLSANLHHFDPLTISKRNRRPYFP
jgi:hypothetical protein